MKKTTTPCPNCGKRPRRVPGAWCKPCDYKRRIRQLRVAKAKKAIKRAEKDAKTVRFVRSIGARTLLITSAQNFTAVHKPFFETLKVAAKHLDAEIIVVPYRYKNPTSQLEYRKHILTGFDGDEAEFTESAENWPEEVRPYLFNQRKKLNGNLVLAADVKIQPTASQPLSGFESLTGSESCIIGAPKMQFRSVAAPVTRYPKILTTTGACTRENYSDTKVGALGEFHHFLGAIIVELDGDYFHIRQINADKKDGSFIDIDKLYTIGGVTEAPPALALVCGDSHARFADPVVDEATFGSGGIVETVRARKIVFEDVLDGYAGNPHHKGNALVAIAKAKAGFGNFEAEVKHTVKFMADRVPEGCEAIVVPSNHDDFLARWVLSNDWRTDPSNAEFYLETALAAVRSVKMTAGGASSMDPFAYWVEKYKGDAKIRCLATGESYTVAGIEVGLHGHQGPNGSRGSLKNLSRLGCKVISGHSHTPGIEEGHYQVGTSTPLRVEYNQGGPSSWQNAHCVVYANGKRSLILIIDGRWRA